MTDAGTVTLDAEREGSVMAVTIAASGAGARLPMSTDRSDVAVAITVDVAALRLC